MKILIADTNETFVESLVDELKNRHVVYSCNDGKSALELIARHCPDVVLLSMHLPGYDGLSILQALECSMVKPLVLAMTGLATDYIVNQLRQFSVEHIMMKPVTVCAAMTQINALICQAEKQDADDLYKRIDQALRILCFRTYLRGYDCLREAIYQVRYNGMTMVTKEIYPAVAKICGGSPSRVEKAIRDVIVDAWKRRDDAIWNIYFSKDRNGEIPCPHNAELISALACDSEHKENNKVG